MSSEHQKVPLLLHYYNNHDEDLDSSLVKRGWDESKKLWHIVGPSIICRICTYAMLVVTQAFAGHLGDHQLAAVSIACNLIVGFDYGLMVSTFYSIS